MAGAFNSGQEGGHQNDHKPSHPGGHTPLREFFSRSRCGQKAKECGRQAQKPSGNTKGSAMGVWSSFLIDSWRHFWAVFRQNLIDPSRAQKSSPSRRGPQNADQKMVTKMAAKPTKIGLPLLIKNRGHCFSSSVVFFCAGLCRSPTEFEIRL